MKNVVIKSVLVAALRQGTVALSLVLAVSGAGLSVAQASEVGAKAESSLESSEMIPHRDFWKEVKNLARRCVYQTYAIDGDGQQVLGPYFSRCQDFKVTADGVRLVNRGVVYYLQTIESEFSDGGDLVDLQIFDERQNLIETIPNVLAFGDVIAAIMGNRFEAQKILDRSLLDR